MTQQIETNNGVREDYIDKPEVARRLKKTVRTIDNYMSRQWLPYYKIGRSVYFKWSEIEAHFAATCRIGGFKG